MLVYTFCEIVNELAYTAYNYCTNDSTRVLTYIKKFQCQIGHAELKTCFGVNIFIFRFLYRMWIHL